MTDNYRFAVAISFAGDDKRTKVRQVAEILKNRIGDGRVFFDEWFEAELAGQDANIVLQKIYQESTQLVVTCVCKRYSEKPWTQEEWRAIQSFERNLRDPGSDNKKRLRFLPLRFGDGDVDGISDIAIVPDVRERSPEQIANLIFERLKLSETSEEPDLVTEPNVDTEKSYDIFISYRTSHQPWVQILANNLERQGYHVFLDQWRLIPGEEISENITNAIRNSRCGILVATPDSSESGWVQKEYDLMVGQASNSSFYFIPITFGQFPDFPFLQNTLAVDFKDSSPVAYEEAFKRLISALEGVEPKNLPKSIEELEYPEIYSDKSNNRNTQPFVEQCFAILQTGVPLTVLAQADIGTQALVQGLKTTGTQQFGEKNVLHIFPPASLKADAAAYFSRLSMQCHLDKKMTTNWEWSDSLAEQLSDGKDKLLLISGFENGADEIRIEFASELRGLHERFENLYIVLVGSMGLASLKYANGSMSILNMAESVFVPELDVNQLRNQSLTTNLDNFSDDQLTTVLAFTGNHPRCTWHCLQRGAISNDSCRQLLQHSVLPAQLFNQYRNNNSRKRVLELLESEHIGAFDPWAEDSVVRELFWNNLLTQRSGKLAWRSDFIRLMGKHQLADATKSHE